MQKYKMFLPKDHITVDPQEEINRLIHLVPLVPGTMNYVMQCSGLTRGELEGALTTAIVENRAIFVQCFRREKLS